MSEETDKKETVTPQDMIEEPEGFFFRVFKKLMAWSLLLILVGLGLGFLFFLGLAIYQGIMWLWPW